MALPQKFSSHSHRLQPGVTNFDSCVTVSTVFQSRLLRTENLEDKARGKPLKRLAIFFSRPNTGLKPGENEMKTFEKVPTYSLVITG